MKIIKVILITLIVLVAIVATVGFLSPSHVRVERSLVIKTPSEIIFMQVNNLKNWQKWSPWYQMDTAMKMEYNQIPAGEGAGYKWSSTNSKVGSGDMTITSSTKDSISTAMNFMEHGIARAKFIFSKQDSSTKVSWIMESDMGMNPIGRIYGLFMDKKVGPDFEKGLANLKKLAESIPVKQKRKYEVKEEDAAEKIYIIKKDSLEWAEISAFYQKNLLVMFEAMTKAKLEMAGSPSGLFFTWDTVNKTTVMAAAIPVKGNAKTKVKGFETLIVPARKNLHIEYHGGYFGIGAAHNTIRDYMEEKALIKLLPIVEEYVTDPSKEPDSTKWLTNVFYPVK